MCQLLGMNCNVPTDIVFSFEGFRQRGGVTDHHSDGWGIAFFEDDGCRMFLDHQPSALSPLAELVYRYPIKSTNVVAHIRKATQGVVSLANTHPFKRELWGRYWLFAHNGNLTGLPPLGSSRFRPVGTTDSEYAFCWIMNELALRFVDKPPLPVLHAALAELAERLAGHGTFNFLMSDGTALFARCATDLHYIVRCAPFATAHLSDTDVSVDFAHYTGPKDMVAVIATQPLTDNECWVRMNSGDLLMFIDGQPHQLPVSEEVAVAGAGQ
ncbi:class II glutamine amidotransferase [Silvimonas iriomotensis]|uniref:Class II glutamine amidotransferase n=1 Tax=Silvimonas iriomotensis TaxID=449662 RepID=A0ABQ2PFE1_9NEIS|nr:class II glutamine amidotransferase [Silvimonas iriomotensis]GGP24001.1 class II glutamine amidotransferase [Silvimonas iriomotensis]